MTFVPLKALESLPCEGSIQKKASYNLDSIAEWEGDEYGDTHRESNYIIMIRSFQSLNKLLYINLHVFDPIGLYP